MEIKTGTPTSMIEECIHKIEEKDDWEVNMKNIKESIREEIEETQSMLNPSKKTTGYYTREQRIKVERRTDSLHKALEIVKIHDILETRVEE